MPDHVHVLVGLNADLSVAELARDIKANSSRFVNKQRLVAGRFSWQEGFGAFSYSRSQIDSVIRYIQNQQRHHARQTFREEYLEFLRKFQVDYDERYIFKPL
jgi:REP element-mobilizing transposase RayT